MFTQNIIDMLNQVFMVTEIISNNYLEREFLMLFHYDDYVSFMNMFVNNNEDRLIKLDSNIIDYLLTFPKIISLNKPDIRIITNYEDI